MSLNNSLTNIYKHRRNRAPASPSEPSLPKPKENLNVEEAKKNAKRKRLEESTTITKEPSGYHLEELGLRAETYQGIVKVCRPIITPFKSMLERCILITGQRGVGKTTLINSIAIHTKMPLIGCDLARGTPHSRSSFKFLFQSAIQHQPCILYIDSIDKAYVQSNQSTGIADEIYTNILELEETDHKVFILLASREAKAIDKDLIDYIFYKIELKNPDYSGRIKILKNLILKMNKSDDFFSQLSETTIQSIAVNTNLYAPRDFVRLFQTVRMIFLDRIQSSVDSSPYVAINDFNEALREVVPILKQEGFEQIPNVTWDDVGGLDHVRDVIRIAVLNQIRKPDGTDINYGGILLYGPPGCGKTLVAKAVANEAGLNFIAVNSTTLMNKYLGETEANIAKLFARARQCEPCMIFFDEVDAISGKRPDQESGQIGVKCVNALLEQMDGVQTRGCFVMAATNRLDCIDPAIIRSGRFAKHVLVGLPTESDRESILKAILRRNPNSNINTPMLAEGTSNFTGADLNALVQEARLIADDENRPVDMDVFAAAKQKIMMYNKNIGSTKQR